MMKALLKGDFMSLVLIYTTTETSPANVLLKTKNEPEQDSRGQPHCPLLRDLGGGLRHPHRG